MPCRREACTFLSAPIHVEGVLKSSLIAMHASLLLFVSSILASSILWHQLY